MDNFQTIFSWLHISDIHFGHGSTEYQWNQRFVIDSILRDIRRLSDDIPKPEVILLTGDIAFSGGVKQNSEYEDAKNWLNSLATSVKLTPKDIFIVPGNHDVQRNVDENNRDVKRLINTLRSGTEIIDDALKNKLDRDKLIDRMKNYLQFAENFAPDCLKQKLVNDYRLYWFHRKSLNEYDININLIGLNTALLSNAEDNDKNHLYLGNEQIITSLLELNDDRNEISIVLSHHPFDWLHDGDKVSNLIKNRCNIHLCGHTHEASSETTRCGTGKELIQIIAGAVHSDQHHIVGHSYSIGAIIYDFKINTIQIRIWPRKWSEINQDFRLDSDRVIEGLTYAKYELLLEKPISLEITHLGNRHKESFKIDNSYNHYINLLETIAKFHNSDFKKKLLDDAKFLGLEIDSINSCIPRDKENSFQKWYEAWNKNKKDKRPLVVFGEKGMGKSCAVAHWLSSLDYSRPIFFIRAGEIIYNSTVESVIKKSKEITNFFQTDIDFEQAIKYWKQINQSIFFIVIDGINKIDKSITNFLTNFYEGLWESSIHLLLICRTEECLEDLDDLEDLIGYKLKKVLISNYSDEEFNKLLSINKLNFSDIENYSLENIELSKIPKEFNSFLKKIKDNKKKPVNCDTLPLCPEIREKNEINSVPNIFSNLKDKFLKKFNF